MCFYVYECTVVMHIWMSIIFFFFLDRCPVNRGPEQSLLLWPIYCMSICCWAALSAGACCQEHNKAKCTYLHIKRVYWRTHSSVPEPLFKQRFLVAVSTFWLWQQQIKLKAGTLLQVRNGGNGTECNKIQANGATRECFCVLSVPHISYKQSKLICLSVL